MAKAAAPKKSVAKKDAYQVDGDKLTRTKPVCPKCGPGVFMAGSPGRNPPRHNHFFSNLRFPTGP